MFMVITMKKTAFFLLSLFVFLQAYHAREFPGLDHVYDTKDGQVACINVLVTIITNEGIPIKSSRWFSVGRENPSAPPTPENAPSGHHGTYGRVASVPPSPESNPPHHQTIYGRGEKSAPPTPQSAPPKHEMAYGGVLGLSAPAQPRDQKTYGKENPGAPPAPKVAPSDHQGSYGKAYPNPPPPPRSAPSHGQTTYGAGYSSHNPPPALISTAHGRMKDNLIIPSNDFQTGMAATSS